MEFRNWCPQQRHHQTHWLRRIRVLRWTRPRELTPTEVPRSGRRQVANHEQLAAGRRSRVRLGGFRTRHSNTSSLRLGCASNRRSPTPRKQSLLNTPAPLIRRTPRLAGRASLRSGTGWRSAITHIVLGGSSAFVAALASGYTGLDLIALLLAAFSAALAPAGVLAVAQATSGSRLWLSA